MKSIVSLLLAGILKVSARMQNIPVFKNQDRIAGNRITDGGPYHSYIGLYYFTGFPRRYMHVSAGTGRKCGPAGAGKTGAFGYSFSKN